MTIKQNHSNADLIQLGPVPQVFCVVRPCDEFHYNLGFFYRENIYSYEPSVPPQTHPFIADEYLRDYIFTKLHNGVCVIKSVPPMNKLFIRPKASALVDFANKWNNINNSTQITENLPSYNKINITIVSGEDLIAKDSNGLSDPFVVVGLNQKEKKNYCLSKDS